MMMQLLYNSDNFSVAAVELSQKGAPEMVRGGYEIVNKLTGKGIYLEGDMAQQFQREVQMIADQSNEGEDLEDYLENYALLMHQVVQN